jgi:hypothetical protein
LRRRRRWWGRWVLMSDLEINPPRRTHLDGQEMS